MTIDRIKRSERRYLMQVPVTRALMMELLCDYHRNDGDLAKQYQVPDMQQMWTTVAVQELCKEMQDSQRISFCFGGFLEYTSMEEHKYLALTQVLLNPDSQQHSTKEEILLLDISPSRGLTRLMQASIEDAQLADTLKDFLRKTIAFACDEGQILDLIGKDNIVFSHMSGQWNYVLADALPIAIRPLLREMKNYVENPDKFQLDSRCRLHLLQAINFVRVVNGAAMLLGEKEYLHVIDIPVDILRALRNPLPINNPISMQMHHP